VLIKAKKYINFSVLKRITPISSVYYALNNATFIIFTTNKDASLERVGRFSFLELA